MRDVVRPADRRFLDMLRDEYLPSTREVPGLVSAPGGEELYRHAIRSWTTLDMDPRDVHQVGLDELAQIDTERRAIARDEGFGDDVDAYRLAVATDPANQAATREELVARATEDIARAGEVAPRVFGRLPRAACEVRPVEAFKEKDAPFAYYYPPSLDGSRSGIYYVNTYDLPSRTYSKLASTTYHEAIPGHHFQISLEMEHPSLNVFRRLGSRLTGAAYAEGWGLYSERLADELGLYRNQAERLGMLDAQAWRASRADRRYRHARPGLVAPGVDRLAAANRPFGDGRGDRDRPLHRVAGPGAELHDRHARDPQAPPGARSP